jgi:hypothetical protein
MKASVMTQSLQAWQPDWVPNGCRFSGEPAHREAQESQRWLAAVHFNLCAKRP